jgi:6-pyruvoyltetrahydropterin/6-carboxytetrahydropterin synthase
MSLFGNLEYYFVKSPHSLVRSKVTYHITKEDQIKFTIKVMSINDPNFNSESQITIYKVIEISSAHQLNLPYESKCNKLHGHNFKIEVWVTGILNQHGMVLDFNALKKQIMKYDHQNLNDMMDLPTAENLAKEIGSSIFQLSTETVNEVRTRVWETHSAFAETTFKS